LIGAAENWNLDGEITITINQLFAVGFTGVVLAGAAKFSSFTKSSAKELSNTKLQA